MTYIARSSDQAYTEELCDKIRELQSQNQGATIWIAGDANLPDIEWKINFISGHSYPTHMNQCLLNTVCDIGLKRIVRFPTRRENTLDIFLTNRPSLIEKCKPVPWFVTMILSLPKLAPKLPKLNRHSGRYSYGSMYILQT